MPAGYEVGEKAVQGLVLAFPPARRRPGATTERVDGCSIDGVEGDIAEGTSEGAQDTRVSREDSSQSTFEGDV